MNIYTLTLNPAYDVHASCDHFAACRENIISVERRDAGGKGINISRALHNAGISYCALVAVGKENCSEFIQQLTGFDLNAVYFEMEGRIRENLTIHHGDKETRISYPGFPVDENVFELLFGTMQLDEDTILTFTGSLPNGVSKQSAKRFLTKLKSRGVKIVLDCRSFDLEDIFEIRPWLVKPNQQEVSLWFGKEVTSVEDAMDCAVKLHESGIAHAIVSMGSDGAVLAGERRYHASAPKIKAVSTIGAGDSSIAGFLAAFVKGYDAGVCLSTAVAFGSAACLRDGTEPPRISDVIKCYIKPQ